MGWVPKILKIKIYILKQVYTLFKKYLLLVHDLNKPSAFIRVFLYTKTVRLVTKKEVSFRRKTGHVKDKQNRVKTFKTSGWCTKCL